PQTRSVNCADRENFKYFWLGLGCFPGIEAEAAGLPDLLARSFPQNTSINAQLAGGRQRRKGRGWQGLIPVRDRSDVILERLEFRAAARVAAPAQCLDGHADIALEANR